jgi:hypothetical protein
MANRKKTRSFALPDELVRQRIEFAGSGAAGVHSDQKARRHSTGQTNRIGSRSSQRAAAIRNDQG